MAVSRHTVIHTGTKHIDLRVGVGGTKKRKGKEKRKKKKHETALLALIFTGWVREQIHSNSNWPAHSLYLALYYRLQTRQEERVGTLFTKTKDYTLLADREVIF